MYPNMVDIAKHVGRSPQQEQQQGAFGRGIVVVLASPDGTARSLENNDDMSWNSQDIHPQSPNVMHRDQLEVVTPESRTTVETVDGGGENDASTWNSVDSIPPQDEEGEIPPFVIGRRSTVVSPESTSSLLVSENVSADNSRDATFGAASCGAPNNGSNIEEVSSYNMDLNMTAFPNDKTPLECCCIIL